MVVNDGSGDGEYDCGDGDDDRTYATHPSGALVQLSA